MPAPVWVNGRHYCLAAVIAVMDLESHRDGASWNRTVSVDSFSFAASGLSSGRPLAAPRTRQGVAVSNGWAADNRPPGGVKGALTGVIRAPSSAW